jgi:predicted nucleotidyltransferase
MQHHETTVDAIADETRAQEDTLALVLTGSVARGTARPDSDVDVLLVVTDEAFARAAAEDRLSYLRFDLAAYDDGYVDVKVVSPSYLAAARERADEPMRASLLGARVVWSRIDGLAATLDAITVLPGDEWDRRVDSFAAQMRLHGSYFLPQGEALEDPYLLRWASVHLANAAARAVLARHRVLFRGPKYLRESLLAVPGLPPEISDAFDALLDEPTPEIGRALVGAVEAFVQPALTAEATLSRFVGDSELAWLRERPAPEAL